MDVDIVKVWLVGLLFLFCVTRVQRAACVFEIVFGRVKLINFLVE